MIDAQEIRRAAALIRQGRLVAFPTETVYGLGANALDAAAVARIFEAKGRPANNPLIVHVDSIEMARGLVEEWPAAADTLAQRFWPGPLTLVLRKKPLIPDSVTAGLATAGLRMPAHPLALALIREAGVPIAAPSANRFTQLSPTTAAHVRAALGESVDLILDGGPTTVGIESTVLSLAEKPPRLYRPSMVSQTEIEELIGPVAASGRVENGAQHSPGQHPKHYSPATRLVLAEPADVPAHGRGVYLSLGDRADGRTISMPTDPAAYAAVLYDTLHRLDGEKLDWIAVEPPPDTHEWAGIRDRLKRAATQP